MNHPTREELVEFLYGETPPDRTAAIAAHLENCPECRREVETWKAVRVELAAGARPERAGAPARRHSPVWFTLRRAAAAAMLVLAGYGAARLAQPGPAADADALRTAVAAELRTELRNELGRFATDQSGRQEAIVQALARMEAQRLEEYANLRRDMETVAVRAEDQFETTRRNLIRLASLDR